MLTVDTKLIAMFKDRVAEEALERAKTLGKGNLKTLEDYKYWTGRIQGLEDALGILESVIADMRKEEAA